MADHIPARGELIMVRRIKDKASPWMAEIAITLLFALLLISIIVLIFTWSNLNTCTVQKGLLSARVEVAESQSHLYKTLQDRQREEVLQLRTSLSHRSREKDFIQRILDSKYCMPPWIRYTNSCYLMPIEAKTWNMSKETCETQKSTLLMINSNDELTFLYKTRSAKRLWIGLTDMNSEGQWRWVNGDPVSLNATSGSWAKNQPDNYDGNEHCAELDEGMRWNDLNCARRLRYICEKPLSHCET